MKNNMSEQSEHTCQVLHFDLFGSREEKYEFLQTHSLEEVAWNELHPEIPYQFFVPKDFSLQEEYEKGFKIDELMKVSTNGIKTHHDKDLVRIEAFLTETNKRYFYRVLDDRWIDYNLDKVERHRYNVMKYMLRDNLSLILCKQVILPNYQHVFISSCLSDINSVSLQTKESSFVFPLYLYSDDGSVRVPNLDKEIWGKINAAVGEETTPEALFDYIYAVLHSPAYRAKYKEFLKIDFPRIPYPENAEQYHRLAGIGSELRKLHLMEEVPQSKYAQYNNPGDNLVDKPAYKDGCVWINKEQCFANVPEAAWNFYIGGYQPAQKWLKDRKGRALTFDDIAHYRKIITVLLETGRLMGEVDEQ